MQFSHNLPRASFLTMQVLVLVATFSIALGDAGAGRSELRGSRVHSIQGSSDDMQPTVAARSLARVETQWRSQALDFMECTSHAGPGDCSKARAAFQRSCGTIVIAIVSASSGDRPTVREYMATVCDEPELKGWRAERCQNFAQRVIGTMTADAWENRNNLDVDHLCNNFWANMSIIEAANIAKEKGLKAKQMAAEHMVAKKEEQVRAAKAAAREAAKAAEKRREEAEARHKKEAEAQAAKRAAEAAAATKAEEERQAAKVAAEAARRAEEHKRSQVVRDAAEMQAKEAKEQLAEAEQEQHEARRAIEAGTVVAKAQPHKITTGAAKPFQRMHTQAADSKKKHDVIRKEPHHHTRGVVHATNHSAAGKTKVTAEPVKRTS